MPKKPDTSFPFGALAPKRGNPRGNPRKRANASLRGAGADGLGAVKPLSFVAPVADTPTPRRGIMTRAANRRFAALKEAAQVLDVLPGEGEALHVLMSGHYDLAHLLVILLERLGTVCTELMVATLSLSARNIGEMTALLDAGKVQRLAILVSDFFSAPRQRNLRGASARITGQGAARCGRALALQNRDDCPRRRSEVHARRLCEFAKKCFPGAADAHAGRGVAWFLRRMDFWHGAKT